MTDRDGQGQDVLSILVLMPLGLNVVQLTVLTFCIGQNRQNAWSPCNHDLQVQTIVGTIVKMMLPVSSLLFLPSPLSLKMPCWHPSISLLQPCFGMESLIFVVPSNHSVATTTNL